MKHFLGILSVASLLAQSLFSFVYAAPAPLAPEERTLIATAYYSPLPNQSFYLRGSYEADIKLNGNGTNGASGKPVFIGMLAAPKSYAFGTKISIAGLGVGSVEDRGGAIVAKGERGHEFDRVDIWMGSGETGLLRALSWGKRTVKARVYADPKTKVSFDVSSIRLASKGGLKKNKTAPSATLVKAEQPDELAMKLAAFEEEKKNIDQKLEKIVGTPKVGDVSSGIRVLQSALGELGYFDRKTTGIFGEATKKSIAKFQLDHGLISGLNDLNAGKLGKLTREKFVIELLYNGVEIDQLASAK